MSDQIVFQISTPAPSSVEAITTRGSKIDLLATNIAAIDGVYDDINGADTIGTVAADLLGANYTGQVGGNIANVNVVAGISDEITALYAIRADIEDVADSIAEVEIVAELGDQIDALVNTLVGAGLLNNVIDSDQVVFTQSGLGAFERKVESKLNEYVSVLDFIPPSEHAAIKNGTSTYDCSADIQNAIDSNSGIMWPSGHYKGSSFLRARSNVHMLAVGDVTWENTSNTGFGSAAFALGNIGRFELNDLTYYSASATTAGTNSVTLSIAVNASQFSAGDFVFVRGGDTYVSGGEAFYEHGYINRVVSVASGVLVLKYPIDEAITSGCEIGNITQSPNTSPVTGDALFATENFRVDGLSIITNGPAGVFREGGGALNCHLNFNVVDCDSFVFNNAIVHSSFSANKVNFIEHLWELAVNSHHNQTKIRSARLVGTGTVNKKPIRISENTRFNSVIVGALDMADYQVSDVPIYIGEGRDCHIEIDQLLATNAPLRIATFASQNFSPTPPRCERNTLIIRSGLGGASQRYVSFLNTGGAIKGCSVIDSVFRGDVSSGAIEISGANTLLRNVRCESGELSYGANLPETESVINCYFKDGIASAGLAEAEKRGTYHGNSDDSFLSAKSQNDSTGFINITSLLSDNAFIDQLYPMGSLRVGDVLNYEIAGDVSSAGGTTKNIECVLSGTKIVDIEYGGSDLGAFAITGKITITSLTSASFGFIHPSGSSTSSTASAGGASISNVQSNPLNVEWRGFLGGAAGNLRIRQSRSWVERHG